MERILEVVVFLFPFALSPLVFFCLTVQMNENWKSFPIGYKSKRITQKHFSNVVYRYFSRIVYSVKTFVYLMSTSDNKLEIVNLLIFLFHSFTIFFAFLFFVCFFLINNVRIAFKMKLKLRIEWNETDC